MDSAPNMTSMRTNEMIDAQMADLYPVLQNTPPLVKQNMRSLLALLSNTQEAMTTSKLHVMLETDSAPNESRRTMTELRIIFSPTINASCPRTSTLLLRAVGFLGLVSKAATTPADASNPHDPPAPQNPNAANTEVRVTDTVPPVPPVPAAPPPPDPLAASQGGEIVRDLNLFRPEHFPAWFPGKPHSDASNGSLIFVQQSTLAKFRSLNDSTITWMYEFFFTQATFAASKKFPHKKFVGVYSHFTADWYKGDFSVGPNSICIMSVTEVSQRRRLRNKEGRERMRLTLAAFYDHEPTFCTGALNYILQHRQVLKERFPFGHRTTSRSRAKQRHIAREQQRAAAVLSPSEPSVQHNNPTPDASQPHQMPDVYPCQQSAVIPPDERQNGSALVPGVMEAPREDNTDAPDQDNSDSAYDSGLELGP